MTYGKHIRIALLFAVALMLACLTVCFCGLGANAAYADEAADGRVNEDFENIELGEPPKAGAYTVAYTDSLTFVFNRGLSLNGGTRIIEDETGNRMLRLGGNNSSATSLETGNNFGTRSFDGFNGTITVKTDFKMPLLSQNEKLDVNLFVGGSTSSCNKGALFSIQPRSGKNMLVSALLENFDGAEVPTDAWFTVQAEIEAENARANIFVISESGGESVCTRVADGLSLTGSVASEIVAKGLTYVRFNSALQPVKSGAGTPNYMLIDNLVVMPSYYRSAREVKVSGGNKTGDVLTGSYSYGYSQESGTLYKWYRFRDGEFSAIDGANSQTYTIGSGDVGYYVFFEVTPVTSDGVASLPTKNDSNIAVCRTREDFSDGSDYTRGVSVEADGMNFEVRDGSLGVTPQSADSSCEIANPVAYMNTDTDVWSVRIKVASVLAGARAEGVLFSALLGEEKSGVSCFAVEDGKITAGEYSRAVVKAGEWLTVRTVLMDNDRYYVEAYDDEEKLAYRSTPQAITDENFLLGREKNGVTFASLVYTADEANAPALYVDDFEIYGDIRNHAYLSSAVLNGVDVGEAVSYDFEITVQEGVTASYALSEGRLPAGVTLGGGGISGAPSEAGNFAFSVDATCGDVTVRATFELRVSARYVITFETNGGSAVDSRMLYPGEKIERAESSKEGFLLLGWCTDAECSDMWDDDGDVVTDSDVTLYAKWAVKVYCVSLIGDAAKPVQLVNVAYGEKIPQPESTSSAGVIEGWYSDPEFTEKWDFSQAVTSNMELYAKYASAASSSDGGCGGELDAVLPVAGVLLVLGAALSALCKRKQDSRREK